jgi:hypothetical protein
MYMRQSWIPTFDYIAAQLGWKHMRVLQTVLAISFALFIGFHHDAVGTTMSRARPSGLPVRMATAEAAAPAIGMSRRVRLNFAQSAGTGRNNHTRSEFVRKNPGLFIDGAKLKPWPKIGSEEWKKQQELDRNREEQLKKSIIICNNC